MLSSVAIKCLVLDIRVLIMVAPTVGPDFQIIFVLLRNQVLNKSPKKFLHTSFPSSCYITEKQCNTVLQ